MYASTILYTIFAQCWKWMVLLIHGRLYILLLITSCHNTSQQLDISWSPHVVKLYAT